MDGAVAFFFNPLEGIGVNISSGRMGLKTSREDSVGSLLFTYYFKFKKKVVVTLRNETIHLLPSEEIDLLNIRVYHPGTMVKFFKNHDFKLLSKLPNSNKEEQFMFKRV